MAEPEAYTFWGALFITALLCVPGVLVGLALGWLLGASAGELVGLACVGAFFSFCIVDGAGVGPLPGDRIP